MKKENNKSPAKRETSPTPRLSNLAKKALSHVWVGGPEVKGLVR
jgi:hypothetical protein